MVKYIITSIFLLSLSPFCSAQIYVDDGESKPTSPSTPRKSVSKPPSNSVNFVIQSNHDCYMSIDGKYTGKILKNTPKTLKINLGIHRFFLESAETGEGQLTYYKLNKDPGNNENYKHQVIFKSDISEVVKGN